MTPEDRKALAEQIMNNPLFALIMSELETSAITRGVNAAWTDHETRAAAMAETRAIRAFRAKCEEALRNNPPTKGAPA